MNMSSLLVDSSTPSPKSDVRLRGFFCFIGSSESHGKIFVSDPTSGYRNWRQRDNDPLQVTHPYVHPNIGFIAISDSIQARRTTPSNRQSPELSLLKTPARRVWT